MTERLRSINYKFTKHPKPY